jgi:hypothetical protein
MGQCAPEFAVGVEGQATIDTVLDNCRKLCSPRLGISMSAHGPKRDMNRIFVRDRRSDTIKGLDQSRQRRND